MPKRGKSKIKIKLHRIKDQHSAVQQIQQDRKEELELQLQGTGVQNGNLVAHGQSDIDLDK